MTNDLWMWNFYRYAALRTKLWHFFFTVKHKRTIDLIVLKTNENVYTLNAANGNLLFLPCVFEKYLSMLVVEWFHFCRFHAWNSLQLFKSFTSNGSHRVAFVRNVTSIIFRSQLANYLYYMTINMNTKLPIDSIVAIQNTKKTDLSKILRISLNLLVILILRT